ncbi:hypothetical protein Vadar_014131 [Vaccinium darrowii]|uniref:Uncharacterized protein n=1 Tax=Vaccinium darrowii TaxID=229202 RepID=A0ACB7X9F1_9ERIC|nr:hypothetical protein Vadar_014131 [Vaccinium darrowii]
MDEIQIAKSKAEILNKLVNSSNYPYNPTGRVSAKLGGEEVDWPRISRITAELALSRARATNRDFRTVWEETEPEGGGGAGQDIGADGGPAA